MSFDHNYLGEKLDQYKRQICKRSYLVSSQNRECIIINKPGLSLWKSRALYLLFCFSTAHLQGTRISAWLPFHPCNEINQFQNLLICHTHKTKMNIYKQMRVWRPKVITLFPQCSILYIEARSFFHWAQRFPYGLVWLVSLGQRFLVYVPHVLRWQTDRHKHRSSQTRFFTIFSALLSNLNEFKSQQIPSFEKLSESIKCSFQGV